jgi:hypothetical protein
MIFGYSNRALLFCDPFPCVGFARLHPGDALADGNDALHRDGGTGSVTANSLGCATFVAMMQPTDLREGDNSASRGWLYWSGLWAILG